MGETVFEQITKSPEVLAKFLKPYIDETILYDMYCEKICTKSEECAKRGCIIDIPSYVQLVTVADIYDALVSNRCYKKAYSHEKAIEMLRKEAVQNKINKKYVERINALRQPN